MYYFDESKENDDLEREEEKLRNYNIQLLFDGYWYSELPPIIDIVEMKDRLTFLIDKINKNNDWGIYDLDNEDFIKGFKAINSPSYIYNDGVEPIIFFEFKKNGSFREMQIPNLLYYIAFVYNTMNVYSSLFRELYENDKYKGIVRHSNSYILFADEFYVDRSYFAEDLIHTSFFAIKNNKGTNQLAHDANNNRYLDMQGSKLYKVKLDIESFYPNIYTHHLSALKDVYPYKEFNGCDQYFKFLDYYNMKINNNQTKGIASGVFSSTLSAELLMVVIDYYIDKLISELDIEDIQEPSYLSEEITYIRYVDDLTFFSDSIEKIQSLIPAVERILNKYRLRINANKTEKVESVRDFNRVDFIDLKNRFTFLEKGSSEGCLLDKDMLFSIKRQIGAYLDSDEIPTVKSIISSIESAINDGRLVFFDSGTVGEAFDPVINHFILYLLQLLCSEPVLGTRCYRLILSTSKYILNAFDSGNDIALELNRYIAQVLKSKVSYINKYFHDTLIQLWHYYVLREVDPRFNFSELGKYFVDLEINPILAAIMVESGREKNRKIFNYIKDRYVDSIEDCTEGQWKNSIMFSKWWFPIFIIYLNDGYNYYGYNMSINSVYKYLNNEGS
ncbi:RNA-directed DNA polymerase [Stomatohabitans albus]|uniref:RNA-directed DNA polymerase n=1 Tax=Stomatohabitans albus TaxID=3110766 RepID=UPI00300D0D40